MPRTRYTPEEILVHLRTVELDTGKGLAVVDACRKLGLTEQTYYRWKKEYGGLRIDQAKRLKTLEQENLRLKRIVANQALDLSSSRRSPRETSKPGPPARGRGACRHRAPRLRAQSVSGDWTDQIVAPLCRATSAGSGSALCARDCAREGIRAVWVSYGHGSLEAGGLGRGHRSRVYDLATRGSPSAAEATQASPALAR